MSAHSLRKKLQTDLEKAGVNSSWIDQILGHQLINSRDAYSLPTDEELREAYLKAYAFIRIKPQSEINSCKEIAQNIQPLLPILQKTPSSDIIEIKANDIQEIKQALLRGYKHADTVRRHKTISTKLRFTSPRRVP
jgi:hypothetical protein